MSAPPDLFANAGLPVPIGSIDRELARLWEESGESKTRASLINLAVYFENPDGIAENTAIIQSIAAEHACRALLVFGRPGTEGEAGARAWISAHCHPAGRGGKQICSEQITFEIGGDTCQTLPGIVFPYLDSDLPLVFWWRADFPATPRPAFWRWVDRLVFDSGEWAAAEPNLGRVRKIARLEELSGRLVLCDLNWTRLLSWRFALASLFDHDLALRRISQIRRVKISRTSGNGIGALLLLGWIASRLGWKLAPSTHAAFVAPDGSAVEFEIKETAGHPACSPSGCRFETDDSRFEITRDPGSGFFRLEWTARGSVADSQVIQAGDDSPSALLLAELGRVGSRIGYHQAIDTVRPLLRAL